MRIYIKGVCVCGGGGVSIRECVRRGARVSWLEAVYS